MARYTLDKFGFMHRVDDEGRVSPGIVAASDVFRKRRPASPASSSSAMTLAESAAALGVDVDRAERLLREADVARRVAFDRAGVEALVVSRRRKAKTVVTPSWFEVEVVSVHVPVPGHPEQGQTIGGAENGFFAPLTGDLVAFAFPMSAGLIRPAVLHHSDDDFLLLALA